MESLFNYSSYNYIHKHIIGILQYCVHICMLSLPFTVCCTIFVYYI